MGELEVSLTTHNTFAYGTGIPDARNEVKIYHLLLFAIEYYKGKRFLH